MLISKRVLNVGDSTSRIDSDHTSITVATELVEYPVANLRTDDVKRATITWGQRRSHTAIESYFSPSLMGDRLDYVAVFGLNRKTPTIAAAQVPNLLRNRARLIIDEYGLSTHNPAVISTGFSTTNLTGTYDILNQTLNPPELPITGGYNPSALNAVNDSLDTVVNLTFNNNSNRPLSGAQEILIHARDSVNTTNLPNIAVVLRQSNVDIATLTLSSIERTFTVGVGPIGGIYRYTFNASTLPSQTLPVQLRITGLTGSSRSVDFLAVKFYSSVTGTLFDSGWQDLEALGAAGDRVAWAPRFDYPTTNGHFVIVQLSDYGVMSIESTGPTLFSVLAVFDPLTIGRFTAGSGLDLPLREQGVKLQKQGNNLGNLIASRGGTLRASRLDQTRWDAALSIRPQSQARVFGEIETFLQSVGATLPAAYVLSDSDTEPEDIVPAFFAVLANYELNDTGLLKGADYLGQEPFTDKRFEISLAITELTAFTL